MEEKMVYDAEEGIEEDNMPLADKEKGNEVCG